MPEIKNNSFDQGYLKKYRWLHLFLGVLVVFLIMLYFWWLREYLGFYEFFVPLLGLTAFVNGLFREGLSKIGLWPQDFTKCFRERIGQLFALSALLLWWIVLAGNATSLIGFRELAFLMHYILIGLIQQYMLNGFFVNRLVDFYGDENNKNIPIVAAVAFSLLHAPNWFLMLATGLGGYFCAKIFLEHKNLYFLGLAHGLVGFLLFHSFSESVTHHFVVGIKYFR